MKKFDVATFGPVFADHVLTGLAKLPALGEEVYAEGYRREAGGGCFNTACGLASLGARAACFAVVGREDGGWLLERVGCGWGVGCVEGGRGVGDVNTNYVRFSDLPTGVTVAASLGGDRAFLTYDGANGELWSWIEEEELVGQLAQARHVHFACALPVEAGGRLVRELRERGTSVSLDAGWQEAWMREKGVWKLLGEVDWFLPNESEARFMTGKLGAEEMLEVFAARGVRGVAVKMGASGAAARKGAEVVRAKALKVDVIDTTGAGDAFDAGFLHGVLAGLPVEGCLERGTICGSLSTRKAGALEGLPKLDEVLQYQRT